jgi:hypothetical protein
MATSSTTMTKKSRASMKGRGKSERTKILDAMKREGKTENGFYDLLIEKAFSAEDNFTFNELLKRLSPLPKAVAPMIEFKFPDKAVPHKQAIAVMKAISDGKIPPDMGTLFIASIQSMLKIQEVTDIDERLKKMEEQIESSE